MNDKTPAILARFKTRLLCRKDRRNICLKKNQLCQLMSDNDVGGERKRGYVVLIGSMA
jgi:hypothetical protein